MFNKDLLLIDIESTGADYSKYEMIQLAAVLLDKKTLREKKSFASYVRPENWRRQEAEAMAVNGITWEQVKNAPSLKNVLTTFEKTFGTNVMLANYGGVFDIGSLQTAYRQTKMKYRFDYHAYNLWVLSYTFMAKHKKLTDKKRFSGFSQEDVAAYLRIPIPVERHDALVDCRFEADIFRALMKRIKL